MEPSEAKSEQSRALRVDDEDYPTALRRDLDPAPPITLLGNLALLRRSALALFCSVRCPGSLILQTYDLARGLRDAGLTVVSGFHTPMEQECLALLLRGAQPVIVCPARSFEGMRVPVAWREPLARGRLAIVSPFERKHDRVTRELAERRNAFVAALAAQIFVAYAEAGGKTEALARTAIERGKPVWTFGSDYNRGLLDLGARPLGGTIAEFANFLASSPDV